MFIHCLSILQCRGTNRNREIKTDMYLLLTYINAGSGENLRLKKEKNNHIKITKIFTPTSKTNVKHILFSRLREVQNITNAMQNHHIIHIKHTKCIPKNPIFTLKQDHKTGP